MPGRACGDCRGLREGPCPTQPTHRRARPRGGKAFTGRQRNATEVNASALKEIPQQGQTRRSGMRCPRCSIRHSPAETPLEQGLSCKTAAHGITHSGAREKCEEEGSSERSCSVLTTLSPHSPSPGAAQGLGYCCFNHCFSLPNLFQLSINYISFLQGRSIFPVTVSDLPAFISFYKHSHPIPPHPVEEGP